VLVEEEGEEHHEVVVEWVAVVDVDVVGTTTVDAWVVVVAVGTTIVIVAEIGHIEYCFFRSLRLGWSSFHVSSL
jgi:hypothetical protein